MEQIGTTELAERTGIPVWRIRYLAKYLQKPPFKVGGSFVWGPREVAALERLHASVPEVPQRGQRNG